MTTLDQDLQTEKRHVTEARERAVRRLGECRTECASLEGQGAVAAKKGDTKGAAACERRAQKLRVRSKRYEQLISELEEGGTSLAAEILLARLSGPELDLLIGEVDRNREVLIQRATSVLRAREQHRALRHRWGELNDKIRALREKQGMRTVRTSPVDFRVGVTPKTYAQKPDGPTFREVSDLLHSLGL